MARIPLSACNIFLTLALSSLLVLPEPAAAAELPKKIKVCGAREDPTHLVAGHYMRHLYERLGIRLQVNWIGGERTLELTNSGGCAAELAAPATTVKDWKQLMVVKQPLLKDSAAVFGIGRSSKRYQRIVDLKGQKVGMPAGETALSKAARDLNARTYPDETALFKALVNGEVDLAVTRHWGGLLVLRSHFANSGIRQWARDILPMPLHHVIRRDLQQLENPLSQEILKHRRGGNELQYLDDLLRKLARKAKS